MAARRFTGGRRPDVRGRIALRPIPHPRPRPRAWLIRIARPPRRTAREQLVSNGSGPRPNASHRSSSWLALRDRSVSTNPRGIKSRATGEPGRLGVGPDEGEQCRARQLGFSMRSGDANSTEALVSIERHDRGAGQDLDAWVALQSIHEVAGHAGAKIGAPDRDRHRASLVGQEHRGLAGGVAASHDHHRASGALACFQIGGGVVDTTVLEVRQPIGLCSRR
jgi:hypothetical protein